MTVLGCVDCRAHARRLAAELVPVDRAARSDPMSALKHE